MNKERLLTQEGLIRIGLSAIAIAVMALVGCTNGQERYETISIKVHEGTKLAFDLSPDGRTIVFDLLGQLWLLPATGGEATPLTDAVRDKSEDLSPVFSPDGQQIAFESDHPRGRGLWLVSRKDGKLRRLTEQEFLDDRDRSPAWSPTDSHIAFVRGFPSEIHILDLETDKVQLLHIEDLPDPAVSDPAWSPDGTRLCFVNASRFKASGGRIWEVGINGGPAVPLTAETVKGLAPVYSPDAKHIAFFSQDSQGQMQLWVQDLDGSAKMLTDHSDTTALRVRWSPDGSALYYSADGQLWHIAATGGSPQAIPFTAELSFERKRSHLKPVRFAPPGVEIRARGHRGLALSPGGKRIAMIALGKLWVWRVDDKPYAVATLPNTADGLAWSPNGQEVAWSAGLRGAEDLFATDVETGKTRRLTMLPGLEIKPSWSPDGQHIAFVHADKPGWTGNRLRIIPAHAAPVEQLETTLDLTEVGAGWAFGFLGLGHEVPQWSPDSSTLLLFDFDPHDDTVVATLVPLNDEPQPLEWFPTAPTFLRWHADGSIVFVQNNMLWQAQFQSDRGMVGEPLPVFDTPAFYLSIAKDGSLLYISEDGLRIRRPDGRVERLGWPLSYQTLAPERLLIRDVRIIDGKEDVPTKLRDILVEGGRIARIASAGEIRAKVGIRVIEAGGRTVIPGLIDLHTHLWDDAQLPGQLYYGVTTVRDMGAAIGKLAARRDAIEAGVRIGPRIVFGGFQFWGTGSLSGETGQMPDDDAGRARAITLARAFRADYVKMRWLGKWDAGARLIDQAHAAGLRVSGHCAHALPLIAAGIDGKEHLGPSCTTRSDGILYEDIIELFQAAQLWVVPTIAAFSSSAQLMDDPALLDGAETAPFLTPFLRWWVLRNSVVRPEDKQSRMAFWERSARIARLGTEKLHKEGVTIGAGSDVPSVPWAMHWELEELVRSGMSPSEAIHAATGAAARILGAEAEIGTIADGKWADLVILDADPLQDIQNTKKIWMVIKGGEIVNRDALLHWSERETVRCESQEQLKP